MKPGLKVTSHGPGVEEIVRMPRILLVTLWHGRGGYAGGFRNNPLVGPNIAGFHPAPLSAVCG